MVRVIRWFSLAKPRLTTGFLTKPTRFPSEVDLLFKHSLSTGFPIL